MALLGLQHSHRQIHSQANKMRAFNASSTSLVFVLMATVAFALASAARAPPHLEKRMMPAGGSSSNQHAITTFDDLQAGQYHHSSVPYRTHPGSLLGVYDGRLFHSDGRPIFVFRDGQAIQTGYLDSAIADFGGFHARLHKKLDVVTVVPQSIPNNVYATSHGDPSLVEHVAQIDHVSSKFHPTAARVAFGYPASQLHVPSRSGVRFWKNRGPETPKWETVHGSWPTEVTSRTDWQELKRRLNQQRYLRFTNAEEGLSLGVRARPDGQIERQLVNGLGEVVRIGH